MVSTTELYGSLATLFHYPKRPLESLRWVRTLFLFFVSENIPATCNLPIIHQT